MSGQIEKVGTSNADLPDGWAQAPFSEVAKARMGPTILAKDLSPEGLPVYSAGQANAAWGYTKREVPVFSTGTIIVSARGSIGFPKIPKEELFTSTQTTIAITPTSAITCAYLQRFLQSTNWAELSSGAAIPMLTISMLGDLAIPLAPLAEQKRIADKLEAVLGRVDACRARLDRVPALLKRFRQSVLAVAISGDLIGVSQDDWKESELGSLAKFINGDRSKNYPSKSARTTEGIPFINAGHLEKGDISLDGMDYISAESFDRLSSGKIQRDDVIYCLRGSLGKCALASSVVKGAIASSLVILRSQGGILPRYLYFYLTSPLGEQMIREYDNGSAQPNLSASNVKKYKIRLPSLPEQQEIVRSVEALFAFADQIEAGLATARKTVERLTPATLAKAFRGDLAPQNPNEEPATELLKRIQSTADKTPKAAAKKRAAKSPAIRSRFPNVPMKATEQPKSVLAALESTGSSLSTSELLHACGLPTDAESATIEAFLIEIRDALASGRLTRERIEEEDYFQLRKQ